MNRDQHGSNNGSYLSAEEAKRLEIDTLNELWSHAGGHRTPESIAQLNQEAADRLAACQAIYERVIAEQEAASAQAPTEQ